LNKTGFAVTGRVVAVKLEADGDLHIALNDATGDKKGTVVCDVPLNRSGVTFARLFLVGHPRDFLFRLVLLKGLKIANPPIVTIVGKAVLGYWPRTERSRQPSQIHAGLRWVGNSSVMKLIVK